jgi:hypothetical protein
MNPAIIIESSRTLEIPPYLRLRTAMEALFPASDLEGRMHFTRKVYAQPYDVATYPVKLLIALQEQMACVGLRLQTRKAGGSNELEIDWLDPKQKAADKAAIIESMVACGYSFVQDGSSLGERSGQSTLISDDGFRRITVPTVFDRHVNDSPLFQALRKVRSGKQAVNSLQHSADVTMAITTQSSEMIGISRDSRVSTIALTRAAACLHDLGKVIGFHDAENGGVIDGDFASLHAVISALIVRTILEEEGVSEREVYKFTELLRLHHVYEAIDKEQLTPQQAIIIIPPQIFESLALLSFADSTSVKGNPNYAHYTLLNIRAFLRHANERLRNITMTDERLVLQKEIAIAASYILEIMASTSKFTKEYAAQLMEVKNFELIIKLFDSLQKLKEELLQLLVNLAPEDAVALLISNLQSFEPQEQF